MTDSEDKKNTENAAHTLVHKALEEMGKLGVFTYEEIKALAEKLFGHV